MIDFSSLARNWLTDYDARGVQASSAIPVSLTIAEAYQLQSEIAQLREARGEAVVGYKVGCVSRAIQEQLGVNEPVFGRLYSTELLRPGATLSARHYPSLAIEGELAVRLAADSPASPSSKVDLGHAIASVFPVIELHRYNLRKDLPTGPQLVVSSGMQAGVVLPETEARIPLDICSNDRLTVMLNDAATDSVDLGEAVRSIAASLEWLSAKLAESGLFLKGGQIVLTGSPMPLFPVSPGARILVAAASLGQASAQVGG